MARGVLGAAGLGASRVSAEENILEAAVQDGTAEAAQSKKPKTDILPGSLPCGKIGNVSVGRLIMGGNLVGGYAHSRDLMYVSRLFKAYNTEAKIFATLELVQACGINTIQVSSAANAPIFKYNQHRDTKLQIMSNPSLVANKAAMNDKIKQLVDKGVTMMFTHGGATDSHMMNNGKIDVIGQAIDLIKAQGLPAGVGSHSLETPIACEKNKIDPDFYVKTFHTDKYWSATPKEHRTEYDWMRASGDHNKNNDNMWCNNPQETAAFMETVDKPWVAFKVMAAGGIRPQIAFKYAYRNGADFIIAGMFDFQVEADVKIAIKGLQRAENRKRAWMG